MEKFENREICDKNHAKTNLESSGVFDNHHIKLWIGTIKNLPKHPSNENAGIFRNKAVTYVDILATVVDQFSYEKADIYVLDDGTGNISCHVKKNTADVEKIEQLRLTLQNDSSIMLISNQDDEGIEILLNSLEKEKKLFTIGDTLAVKGRLSYYKEEWKLFGNIIRSVEFDEENHRCIELNHLYKNIYGTK